MLIHQQIRPLCFRLKKTACQIRLLVSLVGYEIHQLYRPVKYIRNLWYCCQDKLITLRWAGSNLIYANLSIIVALYEAMIIPALNICCIKIVEYALKNWARHLPAFPDAKRTFKRGHRNGTISIIYKLSFTSSSISEWLLTGFWNSTLTAWNGSLC